MQCINGQRDKRSLLSGVDIGSQNMHPGIDVGRMGQRYSSFACTTISWGHDQGDEPARARLVECLTAMFIFGNAAVLQHPQCHNCHEIFVQGRSRHLTSAPCIAYFAHVAKVKPISPSFTRLIIVESSEPSHPRLPASLYS